jgi:5-methylcytosine-specific restriction endonuclease McrA
MGTSHHLRQEAAMPRKRQPRAIWRETRRRVWRRDGRRCQGPYCRDQPAGSLKLRDAHIDHIRSGKLGSNSDVNLRTLCRRCHVLRKDRRHRGLIARALRLGLIPPDWRRWLWE